jgi:RHS repeat-associated protein
LRDGTYEYTYDKEGNRTKRVTLVSGNPTGATTEYEWDHRNRLTKVTEKSAPTGGSTTKIVTYAYDAFDRRIAKTLDTPTIGSIDRYEFYVGSGDNVIFDFVDGDGGASPSATLAKRYLWGESVDQLFAQDDVTTGVLWMLNDNLGTTRDVVDNTGAVVSHYKYDAFGRVTSGDTTKTRALYTSQEYDSDTGLVYYNARWYDAAAARFLSHDSWSLAPGDANLTRYVENSPTNYIDPTGHAPIDTGGLVPPTEEAEGDPSAHGWGEEHGLEGIGPSGADFFAPLSAGTQKPPRGAN